MKDPVERLSLLLLLDVESSVEPVYGAPYCRQYLSAERHCVHFGQRYPYLSEARY